MALNNYGYNRITSGNVDHVTEELLAESLRLRRSLNEKRGVGITLGSIAELQLLRGDLDGAAATVEEMLLLSAALTHAELTCVTFNLHGFLHLARGNRAQAEERFRESLRCSHPMGFQLLTAEAMLGLAEAAALQRDFTRALRFAVVACQVLTAEEQQLASFHQAAISRIERQLEQALDKASPAGDTDSSGNRHPRPGPGRGSKDRPKTDTFPPCHQAWPEKHEEIFKDRRKMSQRKPRRIPRSG